MAESASQMIGTLLLDRYRIDSLLGQGATSDVFRALDTVLEREVAIKVLTRSLDKTDKSHERFLREAKITSKLIHPNIVSIFDFGVLSENLIFLVTELLNGPSLEDQLQKNELMSEPEAISVFRQIAEGLSHAHLQGVVHRDIKPSNVVIIDSSDRKLVKLIDFGMLHLQDGSAIQKLTQEDCILGSAFYMSPEQCLGQTLTASTDIYSLGCLMYECLSGELPLMGTNIMATLQMHISSPPLPLSQLKPIQNPELGRLVMQCLEKNPADRPDSMKTIANELLRLEAKISAGQGSSVEQKIKNSLGLAVNELRKDSRSSTAASAPKRSGKTLLICTSALIVGLLMALIIAVPKTRTASNNKPTNKNVVDANKSNIQLAAAAKNTEQAAVPKEQAQNEKAAQNQANSPGAEKTEKNKQIDHLVSLAQVCHSQGRCDEALELLKRSVELSSKVYGPRSEKTKARMKDLSVMYLTLGMEKEAADTMARMNKVK